MPSSSPTPAASPAAPAAPRALAMEDLPAFLRFTPVPLRPRHDGWSANLQMRLVVELARGAGVEEAARRLGRSPQGAYALRGRPGADSFAAAWDAAAGFAGHARAAAFGARRLPVAAPAPGIETILVPRFYRGRLVGYTLREDLAGALARLHRLDRLADRLAAAGSAGKCAEVEDVEAIMPPMAQNASTSRPVLRSAHNLHGRRISAAGSRGKAAQ